MKKQAVIPKKKVPTKTPDHIKDLIPDAKNARAHNPRNIGMIEKSLSKLGAGRSILIDENNRIIAGNGTIEGAAQAGITKVQVVDVDGDTIVAVRRTNLSETEKIEMALFDNRTAEFAEWDQVVLVELAEEMDLTPFQFPANSIIKTFEGNDDGKDDMRIVEGFPITIVATAEELATFNKLKERLKTKSSFEAFSYLLQRHGND